MPATNKRRSHKYFINRCVGGDEFAKQVNLSGVSGDAFKLAPFEDWEQ